MHNFMLNPLLFNQNQCLNTYTQTPAYQQLLVLTNNLQQTLVKQQLILDNLMSKQQEIEEKLKLAQTPNDKDNQMEAYDSPVSQSLETELSEKNETMVIDAKIYNNERKKPSILRRNGFKPIKRKFSGLEYDENSSFESENSSDFDGLHKGRRNPSKAKHLWVNYGRRIIDYAASQTEGEVQEKVRQLTGKLNSKKDYEKTFGFLIEDSVEERKFKNSIGQLAIDFVKRKASPTFEGAKHKDDMLAQRHVVAGWIEKLMSTENGIEIE